MISEDEVKRYLEEAESNALVSLAAHKFERFGYWAAQCVHLRKILGVNKSPSPFRAFVRLAREILEAEGIEVINE